jgi:hypothetical protein
MIPKPKADSPYEGGAWHTATEELLWNCFGSFTTEAETRRNEDCIIMIRIGKNTSNPRIVAQNQVGIGLFSHPVSFDSIKPDYSQIRPSVGPQTQPKSCQLTYSGLFVSNRGFRPNRKSPLFVAFSANRLTLSN